MFTWHRDAKVCYAYLADIPAARWSARDHYSCLRDSRWFSRGWTLQELLAPKLMMLYGTDWNQLGTRDELSDLISRVSGIHVSALHGDEKEIDKFSIAQRMCWASRRETTRSEDIAYCLLGLFDVNMPLLYGEGGKKAFIRLQEEIMKNSDDHTLFAWNVPEEVGSHWGALKEVGLLAEHPIFFRSSKDILSFRRWDASDTFSMTNKGLRITIPLTADVDSPNHWIAHLDCHQVKGEQRCAVGIPLQQLSRDGDQFARVAQATRDIPLSSVHDVAAEKRAIYIRKEIIRPDDAFKGDIHRLREFRLVQTPSTHELVERYGSANEGSGFQKLLAPPKTTSYWIDPLAWANWHVVCLFEEKESMYRAQTSNFIIVLDYDVNSSKAWCVIEPYNHQSLLDIWDQVHRGKSDVANKVLLKGRSIVQVNVKPAVGDPGVVEVHVKFNYYLGDSNNDGILRDMDPLSIFSGTDGVADVCIPFVKYLEGAVVAASTFKVNINKHYKDLYSSLEILESRCVAIGNSMDAIKEFIKDLEALGAVNKAIQATAEHLKNCRKALEGMKRLLGNKFAPMFASRLFNKNLTSPHDATLLHESLNLEEKKSETKERELGQSLANNILIYHKILHMSLLMARLYNNEGGNGDRIRSFDELAQEVKTSQLVIAAMSNTSGQVPEGAMSDLAHNMITSSPINDLSTTVNAAIEEMHLATANCVTDTSTSPNL
ncbi:uncharacterized protein PAC_05425 [Phialocephala subalpina]|uniref:DUF8212 domain-containing protein n=1 Tax=Phialocephala subalpina TaxID=576137 RepID=A0A1L7WS06_9HELO|nr:uncharacterized protein PAC_05425 [Phialocephala subalpina]